MDIEPDGVCSQIYNGKSHNPSIRGGYHELATKATFNEYAAVGELLLPTLPSLLVSRGTPYVHRDLSWVQFNERVLAEARNIQNPPLERLKFLGITSSNLDEFFMIRFASLNKSIRRLSDPKERGRLLRIRANLLESVSRFMGHQTEAFEVLATELAKEDVYLVARSQEGDEGFELGRSVFSEQVLPRLSPPEPFLLSQVSTLDNLQMAVIFGQQWLFKIPKSLPWVFVHNDAPSQKTFVYFLDDLLATHLAPSFRISGLPGLVRMTRDGDLGVDLEEEDPESIPEHVRSKLSGRERGRPVRLQWSGDLTDQLIQKMIQGLRISSQEVFPAATSMGLHGIAAALSQIQTKSEALRFRALQPMIPKALSAAQAPKVFSALINRDFLLHHPYDSFDSFVNWIKAACTDPEVLMIEQTVYRVDALSPVLEALKSAAKTKRVRVIIELRARFDELNNLKVAEELRQAGVEVAFGFGKLKLHAKVALVTRKEAGGTRLYTHLSTGNYNAATARQYTDLGLLTSNPEIGADARTFFDSVWEQKVPSSFKQLVSAPLRLHRKLLSLIEAETQAAKAGRKARIVAKVNALVDETVTASLYRASQAGVQIDLIVRGACSLVPGVKGLSDNIRVISIVDRFLEHSRIYYFADSKAMYLSSADWMPRNFFSRLELAFPILDPRIYQYLEQVLIPLYFLDTVKAQELTAQGIWKKRTKSSIKKSDLVPEFVKDSKEPLNAQAVFERLASTHYKTTSLSLKPASSKPIS